jgi:hypothetical protein
LRRRRRRDERDEDVAARGGRVGTFARRSYNLSVKCIRYARAKRSIDAAAASTLINSASSNNPSSSGCGNLPISNILANVSRRADNQPDPNACS